MHQKQFCLPTFIYFYIIRVIHYQCTCFHKNKDENVHRYTVRVEKYRERERGNYGILLGIRPSRRKVTQKGAHQGLRQSQ